MLMEHDLRRTETLPDMEHDVGCEPARFVKIRTRAWFENPQRRIPFPQRLSGQRCSNRNNAPMRGSS